ncbi:MAG: hypothetical protein KAV82_04550, partial [Phycisphaerae bacterium]|nr:hypothetical protein [Phycisphaerae bacterium]
GQVVGWHGQGPLLEDVHLAMTLPGGPCPCWALEALWAPRDKPTDKARVEALVVVPGLLARALSPCHPLSWPPADRLRSEATRS